jgi:hypothetical protein
MYENKHITEPKWKSWIVQTTTPLFTPDQCRQIIESGRRQPPQKHKLVWVNQVVEQIQKKSYNNSWIPFKEMSHMYEDLNNFIQKANENHFGFGDIQLQKMHSLQNTLKEGFMIGIWIVM